MAHVTNGDSTENYMSIADNCCSQAVELNKLSRLLAELDDTLSETTCSGPGCTDPSHSKAVNIVKLKLGSSADRYVIYTAQKVLVTLLKHNACQEGLNLIQQMFNDDQQWQTIQTGLQICRQLFSKQSCHRYLMFYKLNSSICKVWNKLTNVVKSYKISIETDQCLYECCSIFIKVVKMFDSKSEEVFEIFLKQILSTECLCYVLLLESVKYYVKSKVIQFLCAVMQLGTEKQEVFMEEKISASSTVFKNLCSRDLRSTYIVIGIQTFVGIQYEDVCEKQRDAECTHVNIAHLRDWTYLLFTVSSCLIHQQDYVTMVTKYLSEVDTYLQEVLNMSSQLPFPWLPQVYSEQDDVWINVLLLILHIYPVEYTEVLHASKSSPYRQQHHMHFLKFIGTLGYDHLVLIDLLTSPETKCLSYITKYLKLLYSSWNEFIHVTELLSSFEDDTELLTDPEEDTDLSADPEDDTGLPADPEEDMGLPEDDTDNDKESSSDELQTSISETMCKMAIESNDNTISASDTISSLSTMYSDCVSVRTSNDERNSIVCKGGGLALIAGAYDDDSDDDCDDNQSDCGLSNDNVKTDTYTCKVQNLDTNCSEKYRNSECNDTVTVSGEKYGTCANSKSENNVNIASTVCEAVSDCVQNIGDRFEDQLEDDDFDLVKYKSVLKDLNEHTADLVNKENELLDNAMSMLIRTRLKLEKLRDSGLISYNPNVLIQLISSVEGFYEGNESND